MAETSDVESCSTTTRHLSGGVYVIRIGQKIEVPDGREKFRGYVGAKVR